MPKFERKTAFRASRNIDQAVSSGTPTTADFNQVEFDAGSNFNLTTNAYIVPMSGIYFLHAVFICTLSAGSALVRETLVLQRNGVNITQGTDWTLRNTVAGDRFTLQVTTSYNLLQGDDMTCLFSPTGVSSGFVALGTSATFQFSGFRLENESRVTLLGLGG